LWARFAPTPQPGNLQVIQKENCTPDGIPYNLLGRYGQSGRNILSGPAYSDTDFAIFRDFAFGERYKAELRGEFFNIFNQVNFNNPDNTVTDPTFGQILGANSGRVIQVSLKFFWWPWPWDCTAYDPYWHTRRLINVALPCKVARAGGWTFNG
jgi:hypothetical protein